MTAQELNQSKGIKISTVVLIALILLFILATFAQYYSMKLNFTNPLLPESLVQMATMPFLKKGIFLAVGLITILVCKHFKKNLLAFSIAILLIAYYILSDHFIGGWHTEI